MDSDTYKCFEKVLLTCRQKLFICTNPTGISIPARGRAVRIPNRVLLMDDVDRKILEMLIKNSRTPYKEIAKKTKISDVAVHKRIKKLEKSAIKAFTVLIHQEAVGRPVTCILNVRCSISDTASIAREIASIGDVTEVYTTLGEYDIVAKIRTAGIAELREIVERRISKIKGINEVRASVVFECLKEDVSLVF